MSKHLTPSNRIERKLKALTHRVSFLERALKPAKKAARDPRELDRTREQAEQRAQTQALHEYLLQRKIKRYLENPKWLAADLASEREFNDFLRSKGLKPMPSDIPEQFHRGLKKYRPKAES